MQNSINSSHEPVTEDAVRAKMAQLDVTGFHSMSPVSLETQMSCLNEIERIVEGRKEEAQARMAH